MMILAGEKVGKEKEKVFFEFPCFILLSYQAKSLLEFLPLVVKFIKSPDETIFFSVCVIVDTEERQIKRPIAV